MHKKHKEVAIKFAKKLGCQQDNPKEIAQYLRNVPAIDLVKCTKVDDKVQGVSNLLQWVTQNKIWKKIIIRLDFQFYEYNNL